jgi:hypothetical protein
MSSGDRVAYQRFVGFDVTVESTDVTQMRPR